VTNFLGTDKRARLRRSTLARKRRIGSTAAITPWDFWWCSKLALMFRIGQLFAA